MSCSDPARTAAICRLRLQGFDTPSERQIQDEVLEIGARRCAAGAPWAEELSLEYLRELEQTVGGPKSAADVYADDKPGFQAKAFQALNYLLDEANGHWSDGVAGVPVPFVNLHSGPSMIGEKK